MAEGGEIDENMMGEDGYDEYGYNKDGYDEYGYDEYGKDKDGNVVFNEDGYDKFGFDRDGFDRDGKMIEQGEGEHIPLLKRTSTSKTRETQRPFKPRVRTSTGKEVSFANPSYHVADGEMETSFGGIIGGIPKLNFDEELREQVRKHFPNMNDAAVEVKMDNGRLSVRLIGIGNEKWKPVLNKDREPSIQFNKGLKKALGNNRKELSKSIKEKIKNTEARNEKLDKYMKRVDLSSEVMDTTRKERNENEKVLIELEQEYEVNENKIKVNENEIIQENESIQNQTLLKERIKEIFKKYGFTIGSVVTAVGVVIGVIVSKLTSGLSSMAKGVGNGLKDIGKKLAEILPGMVGAIASFIFKTAGEVLGFLAENAWILVVAVVVYLVESLKKKSKR